ncbi:MAG: hypothetical protein GY722_27095 [bacterium]|nr:hypothetical protein [bacterium]
MEPRTAHEPEAEVMSAADVWDDARRLAEVLQNNASKTGHVVRLQVPLSAYLAALDDLSREDLVILRKRLDQRLAS